MTICSSRYSSACSGTSDWTKSVLFSGSMPGADPVGDVVERVVDDRVGGGVVARQRVPVGDEVEAVVLALQRLPVLRARRPGGPRCSRPVGRMPETTRLRGVITAANQQQRSHRDRDHVIAPSTPVSIKRVQDQEAVGPELIDQRAPPARGSRPVSTLPPSSGGTGIMLKTASSTFSITPIEQQTRSRHGPTRGRRPPDDDHRRPRRRRSRQEQVADRPGGRDDREVAPRRSQVAPVRPAPASPSRSAASPSSIATSGNSTVPIQSMCASGLSVSRPSSRAVGSPSRSAVHACAASWNDSDSTQHRRTSGIEDSRAAAKRDCDDSQRA